jgi:NAD-dependent SIR2 family protein deacetylase
VHSSELAAFIADHPRLFVLTGAGVSTGSGIPAYRDADGRWSRKPPMTHQEFTHSESARKRYWARSLAGWPAIAGAAPNAAHDALARLERAGRIARLVTQNVDGLHERAGSERVIDLHGRLDRVVCLGCAAVLPRSLVQRAMEEANPAFVRDGANIAPDGDMDLEADFETFEAPRCPDCAGPLKPDVVFFGDGVPRTRVDAAFAALGEADAVLIVGSSLMAYSGYRFCERASELGRPIAAVNRGRTRADDLLSLKVEADCVPTLASLAFPTAASATAAIDIRVSRRHDRPSDVRYQLLLRFPGDAFDDFEDIVDLESELAERLGEQAAVETHDVGSDECRIALLTADPVRAFDHAKAVLEQKGLLEASVALYRPVGGKDYTVLWPRDSDLAFPD